jgi:predicted small secreted protein
VDQSNANVDSGVASLAGVSSLHERSSDTGGRRAARYNSRFIQELNVKTILCLIAMLLAVSACNTVEGFGKDMKKGGEAIEKAADKNKGY